MTAQRPPFRDPALTVEERVADLLGRLTLPERVALLHQFAPAVPRLGVGAFRTGQEALHGVTWMGRATVFPQAVGLGATWNPELLREVGEAVGREVRAMRAKDPRVGLNVWSPTVNPLRHPLWGRNEEGYAEDARLTGELATAYTRGLAGDHPVYRRTAPVLKHWLAHNHEVDRDTASTSLRPRVLREYELPAYAGPLRAGAAAGVMPAYNLVNGRPNHLSPLLAELRGWQDEPLVVCSDAGAPSNIAGSQGYLPDHAAGLAASLRAGVDSFTDHGEDSAPTVARLTEALERGLIEEADIDRAAGRLLAMRFRLGEFDPELDPFAADDAHDTAEHRELARLAAEQAVVLLKNDGLLPLAAGRSVAVLGPLADEVKLDWYSGALTHRVSPLDGLRSHPATGAVTWHDGADVVRLRAGDSWVVVPADAGAPTADDAEGALDPALLAGRTDLSPLTVGPAEAATELRLVDWGDGAVTLSAPNGRYLSVAEDGLLRASAEQPGGWVVREVFTLRAHGDGHLLVHRASGTPVVVAAEGLKVAAPGEDGTVLTVETVRAGTAAVAEAAAAADVVVLVLGNDPHINGRETEDRTTLTLPPAQEALWRAAHAANPDTALVLVSSYPYAVPAADAALPALLWTAHGGQAAGSALARVLHGEVSPAGRLPQTWYADDADLPDIRDYDLISARATYLYSDAEPLYPFGHGLSYTRFEHRELTVTEEADGTLLAEVTVVNVGEVAGAEVVQLYAGAVAPELPRPHRWLVGHQRVELAPGESLRTALRIAPDEALGHWDVAHSRWTLPPGEYRLAVGASSRDLRATVSWRVAGEPAGPRPVRELGLAAADFDEVSGAELVDRSPTEGDAVAPADPAVPAELRYRGCDLAGGVRRVTVWAAAPAEGGTLTVALADVEVSARVPATGDRYRYQPVPVELPRQARGVRELRLVLGGAVRVDRLTFE
ncbi:glycoside hydrolase family 3 C-terminal domain-containing protein [Streptomyces sp. DSM 44915]|uniref:Glycoside hydrolase family 3 C-terminal domain-containing protein n=1 Tax=Streptomyces chisholmiae TaxID=3075540 RepID=A0ABU2JWD8_9ACTN|nr:glycoside hydrolase family 3 C-terminal domain-containing protein [Streptomyces sp. DSM 44915]MDT0269305.1 glycoside hydrolase family 3 C-terminal domain-containing protein [Streptomyces sp. DSM 44915]